MSRANTTVNASAVALIVSTKGTGACSSDQAKHDCQTSQNADYGHIRANWNVTARSVDLGGMPRHAWAYIKIWSNIL